MSYNKLARFYDSEMGDRTKTVAYIRDLIVQRKPEAKTLLELACGTGAILQGLAKSYDVVGLDMSSEMLSIARKKLPRARLVQKNMVAFSLGREFDVVICVFDSINHVLKFRDWKRIFHRVALHLTPSGLFLFDINTEAKLKRLIRAPIWVNKFGRNIELIDITAGRGGIANWNIKVFEPQTRHRYQLFEENLKEISFPVSKIREALRQQFHEVTVIDPQGRRLSNNSDRLYFACKR